MSEIKKSDTSSGEPETLGWSGSAAIVFALAMVVSIFFPWYGGSSLIQGGSAYQDLGLWWGLGWGVPLVGIASIGWYLRGSGPSQAIGFLLGLYAPVFFLSMYVIQFYQGGTAVQFGDFVRQKMELGGHLALFSSAGFAVAASFKNRFNVVFSVDLRSLAFLRVFYATMILSDIFHRIPDVDAHYTDFGVLPRHELIGKFLGRYIHSVYLMNGQAFTVYVLMAIASIFALLFMMGYRTKLFHFLSWFMLISLHGRNPMVLQAGDVLFRQLMFWSMFLPLGGYWSVDAALNNSEEKPPRSIVSIGGTALMVQAILVYVLSAAMKTHPDWFPRGNAVYLALSLDHFSTPIAQGLVAQYLEGTRWVTQFLTLGTYWLEWLGPFLFLSPFASGPVRTVMVFVFWALHIGFLFTLKIGMFVFVSCASVAVFLPTWFWDKVEARAYRNRPGGLTIWYDDACGMCHKGVYMLRTFFILKDTELRGASTDANMLSKMTEQNSWVVVTPDGKHHVRAQAFEKTLQASPLFWPFASRTFWLPFTVVAWGLAGLVHLAMGVDITKWSNIDFWVLLPLGLWTLALLFTNRPLMDKCYRYVADNRFRFAKLTKWVAFRPYKWRGTWYGQTVVGFLLIYVMFWNVSTLKTAPKWMSSTQQQTKRLGYTLRLDQKWNMFAPYPLKDDGWFIMEGQLADGRKINLFSNVFWGKDEPLTDEKPKMVSNMYPGQRWRKYLMNNWMAAYKKHRLHLGRYICRYWNSREVTPWWKILGDKEYANTGVDKLQTFNIYYMKEKTTLTGHEPLEKRRIWRHWCFKRKGTFSNKKDAKPDYPPEKKKPGSRKRPKLRPAS